ncbi:ABC transporter ATP-binding protein [filamentous cyanobacterium LEGE 07170]|nr:ABC transporter ATP-binding protein [filamentous cyanobacterium LEGE 07170]
MLEVQHLSVNYRQTSVLEDIHLVVHPGELVGLIGPNGAGKSTLIQSILGLVPAHQGQVLLDGQPLRRCQHRIAYVPQRSHIDWDYPITAWNVVMMAQTRAAGWFRRPNRDARRTVWAALERVEMLELRHRQIRELSGGQQQRVFLARALAQQADFFFLDEPFTGIDKKTEAVMLRTFTELQAQNKALLVCSHEWGDALRRYDRLLLLNRTLLADDVPDTVMTLENMQRAYSQTPSANGIDRLSEFLVC